MTEYQFTGAKWGGRPLGSGGGQVTWSFSAVAGNFYTFDAPIGQSIYQSLVRDAFQAWENVANIDFVEVADSASSMIRLGWDSIDGPYNTVGEAKYSYWQDSAFDQLSRADIRFDTAETWTTEKHYVPGSVNFFAVAVHEIGHAIGLAHTDERDTIMFPSIGTQVALSSGDIAGAQSLYGAKLASGATTPVMFTGTGGDNTCVGTGASEFIAGGIGDDRLTGGGGDDRIDGGAGFDIASFSGHKSEFRLTVQGTTGLSIVDLRSGSPDGTDYLVGVERLQFTDGVLAFDFMGTAGQAYRLYQAAFDRSPDFEGLGFWINQMDGDSGDLTWVAHQFQYSQEFRSLYGEPTDLTDSDFLGLLYQNVLDRAPDAPGFGYWMNEMDGGLSRDRLLACFSESQENAENVASAIGDGIWYV